MEKKRSGGVTVLGIFDLMCAPVLFIFAIMLQGFSYYLLLALLYCISAILILRLGKMTLRILLFGIMPLIVLASTLVIIEIISLMKLSPDAHYYTSISAGLTIIGLTILFPFLCNIIYLTRPKVKEQYK